METTTRVISFGKPIIGDEERNAVQNVLNGPILVHGPKSKEFESEFAKFTKAPFAVSVSSCTAALHLSYFCLGLKPGDEVIVPAQTHTATAHAVELLGAKPVFVDSERETGNIDIDQIEPQLTSRTRAISVVHFLGVPVNMDRINQIAHKHGLFVLEDCALGIGSFFKGVHVGLHGHAGCFSFYPVKHMTTAEGGMLITKDGDFATKIQRQKAFGVDRHAGERDIPGVYDVTMLGFNYRMNEIEAALGIEQIKRLDDFLTRRGRNYKTLGRGLDEIPELSRFRSTGGDYQSSHYCMSILLKEPWVSKRFEIVNFLKQNGVGTSVYYPRPVPKLTYYRDKYAVSNKSFPVATWISEASISLPVGPHLDQEDMSYIVKVLKNAFQEIKKH